MRYAWICTCSAGECDFDTKREAEEACDSQFCGQRISLKKRRLPAQFTSSAKGKAGLDAHDES